MWGAADLSVSAVAVPYSLAPARVNGGQIGVRMSVVNGRQAVRLFYCLVNVAPP